jgi:hypothetical protein
MQTRSLRGSFAVLSAGAAVAVGSLVAAPVASSSAAPSTAPAPAPAICPVGKGVTVIVDFGSTTTKSCAPGDPTSGLTALKGAGFTYAFVARFPGMVCRINGKPTPAQDACVVAPPSTKYWSYWTALRGGTWTYATVGAGTDNPKPGTVRGWAYGAGKPPAVAVPK